MQIRLEEDEIHEAVDAYVRTQINLADNQEVSIDFTAGRGPNGLSASIQITAATSTASTTKTASAAKEPEPQVEPEVKAEPETSSYEYEENVPETDNDVSDDTPAESEAPRRDSLFAKASAA